MGVADRTFTATNGTYTYGQVTRAINAACATVNDLDTTTDRDIDLANAWARGLSGSTLNSVRSRTRLASQGAEEGAGSGADATIQHEGDRGVQRVGDRRQRALHVTTPLRSGHHETIAFPLHHTAALKRPINIMPALESPRNLNLARK